MISGAIGVDFGEMIGVGPGGMITVGSGGTASKTAAGRQVRAPFVKLIARESVRST
ncbi:hypothetical protein [Halostagnicola sp. A56]|uniref:hypothetical protein n=1 Tax=Halostagnicola sp. A56 TaxID=1495067 RepID=UPI0012E2165F|nr:hypothetical protein [Halostagnicola sp. A56]